MAAPMSQSLGPQNPGPSGAPGAQLVPGGSQQQQQQLGLAQQQQEFDPVQRYRMLIPQLKESLQNLMKIAALNLAQNTNIDNGQLSQSIENEESCCISEVRAAALTAVTTGKIGDGSVQRFDKSLEEFYALCDQLELCLRLAYECLSQSYDSAKHSPTLVPTATKPDAVQTESLPYTQYLSMIKSQIACAKDIHNALLECSKKITGKTPTTQGVL